MLHMINVLIVWIVVSLIDLRVELIHLLILYFIRQIFIILLNFGLEKRGEPIIIPK